MSDHAEPKKNRTNRQRADLKAGFLIPLRPLPQSLDAEKALLGSILQSPSTVIDECVTRQITAGHFLQPSHALIFSTLLDMHGRRMPIDLVSLTQFLSDAGQLDNAGGAILVTDLFTFVPTPANAGFYADIVQEKFLLRQIIAVCSDFTRRSYEEQGEVRLLLGEFESEALGLSKNHAPQNQRADIKQLAIRALQTIENLKSSNGAVTGLSTGFPDLDRQLNGLHPGEMVVIAARPSMEKPPSP